MIEDRVLQMARKAMLDNVEALSVEDLQKELRSHLQKEFDLIDRNKKFTKFLDDLLKEFKNTPADNMEQELQRQCCVAVLEEIIDKFSKI